MYSFLSAGLSFFTFIVSSTASLTICFNSPGVIVIVNPDHILNLIYTVCEQLSALLRIFLFLIWDPFCLFLLLIKNYQGSMYEKIPNNSARLPY